MDEKGWKKKEDINKISKFVDERNIEQVISDSGVGNEIDWAVIGYLSNDDFELPEDLLSHLGYDGVKLKEREGIESIYIFNQDNLNYLGVADARETITETPDNVEFVDSDGHSTYVDWAESDALVFGYLHGELLTDYSIPHFSMIESALGNNDIELPDDLADEIEEIKTDDSLSDFEKEDDIQSLYNRYAVELRDEMEYDGRLWTMWKIISFWRYPENKSKLYSILQDIERKENLDIIDNNYKIEVRDEEGEYFVIPIEDYQGKYHKEVERKPHEMPDMKWRQMGGKKSTPHHTQYKLSKMGKIPAKYRFYREKNVAEQIIYDEIRKIAESNEKWIETDDDDYLKVMITKQPKYYEQIKDYSITSLKQELKRLKNELNNYRYGDAEYDDYYDKYNFVERFMAYKEKVKINELYNKLMNQPFLNGKIKDFDLDFEDGKRKFTIEVDTDIDLTVDLKFNDIHYYDHTNDIGKSQDVNKIIDPSEAILDSKDLKIVNLFVKLINLYYKQNFKLIKPVLTDSKPFEKPQFTNEDFKWMIGLGGDNYKIKEADVKVDLDDYYKVIYLSIVISDGNYWNDITYKYGVRLDDAFKPKSEDFQEYKTFTEYKDTHYINEDVYDEIRKAIIQINPESKIVNTLRSIPNY